MVRYRSAIIRDTVVASTAYAVSLGFKAEGEETAWTETGRALLRYDPQTTRVMRRLADGTEGPVTDSLSAAFGEFVEGPFTNGVSVVRGGVGAFSIRVGEDQAPMTAVKGFYDLSYGFADVGSPGGYGAGVGRLPQSDFGFCFLCRDDLTYLRVVDADGTVREYGARYAVAADDAPEIAGLALSAFPNPTAGPLALALDGAAPTVGTVEAFDALGRRVWQQSVALAASRQRVEIDAGAWAPGLYVVRVTADGQTATARVVRR